MNPNKKTRILEEFWKKSNIIEGISTTLILKFEEFVQNLNQLYFKRDLDLRNVLVLHDCGLDNYLKYYKYALELYDNGIHKPDCKIVVDAHDCGLIHDDLTFVSNDNIILEAISSMDTSKLHIVEFKSIHDVFN